MGILPALWRLSRLSWVSHGARRWPGLCITWWMPAEKAPFQAARGSFQRHSVEETCWHHPAMHTLPCSLLPIPGHHSSSTCLEGCRPVPPHQPPPRRSPPWQDPQELCFGFASSKSAQVPICVPHRSPHRIRILSSILGPGSFAWEAPCPTAPAGAGPCPQQGRRVHRFSPALPAVGRRQHPGSRPWQP